MEQFPAGQSFARAALDAIARAEMVAVDMRYFTATDNWPADYCRDRVRSCDIYIAVVGFRYGTTVPGQAISYTQLEFFEATYLGIPRLIFLLEESTCPARRNLLFRADWMVLRITGHIESGNGPDGQVGRPAEGVGVR